MSVSSGTMSVGVMAIFSGLLGAYGLRHVLLGENAPPAAAPVTIAVPLATADLPAGRRIALTDISLQRLTPEQMAEAGISNSSVMLGTEFIVGRTLKVPIQKDGPFLTTSMYLEGSGQNIAELLKPGQRAVTIEVSSRRGGSLSDGTVVDVLFRSALRPATDTQPAIPETTVTLFEAVTILNVDRPKAAGTANDPRSLDLRTSNSRQNLRPTPKPLVTLSVSLAQANMLQTVEGRGELTLVPRAIEADPLSNAATDRAPQERMTLENLLGVDSSQPFTTEIFRGGARETVQFDKNGLVEQTH